jgi:hypothetical protein
MWAMTTPDPNAIPISDYIEWFNLTKKACEDLSLRLSAKQAERILTLLKNEPKRWEEFFKATGELRGRIEDELSEILLLQVAPSRAELFGMVNPFGDTVARQFPSVCLDAEEAAKCLALERNTACVFHLMRAMEVGLRALGKALNDPTLDPARNPNWENILRRCDAELRKPLKDRSPEWSVDDEFFSAATANLRAVKDAWRNPSIHVGSMYDNERAADVFNVVKAFMRHLATKLSE